MLVCSLYYNRMSRVRQFGDLRNSRTERKQSLGHNTTTAHFEKASSTHSHYVCVNCVNRSMSHQKHNLRDSQRDRQNSYLLQTGREKQEQERRKAELKAKRAQQQRKKVLMYNKNAMKANEQRKESEKERKEEEKKVQQFKSDEYQKKLMEDRRRQALLKQTWRKDIDRQVQIKNEKVEKQKEDKMAPIAKDNEREKLIAKHQQETLDRYRTDLLNQIKEEEQRRGREKVQRSKQKESNSFGLLDKVEQRTKMMQLAEQERKQRLLEQRRAFEARQEQKRLDEKRRVEEEKAIEKAVRQQEQQRTKQISQRRQSQIKNYLSQIKQQIEDKSNRLRTDVSWRKATINEPFIKDRTVDEKLCNSCEKSYPKAYLTKVE